MTDDLNLIVRHLITQQESNGFVKEVVLYLNASTPYEFEYWVNSYNSKGGCGSGSGYDRLDWAIDAYNKIELAAG